MRNSGAGVAPGEPHVGDEKKMKPTYNITLTAILLFTVGCASKPPAIISTKDHPENFTNNVSQGTPAEIAPMTKQERNYYKDNAKGKFLGDVPK